MCTELAARDQKMIDDLVQPMCLALQEQYVAFKQASPREQNRMLAAIVFENLTTGLLTKGVKLTAVKAGKAAARLATGLSEARTTTTVATTAEGLKFPVRVADDALVAHDASLPSTTLCAMEKQAQKAGAKVEGGLVKDSQQVIAKYERYIQTMRLRIPKLEKYLEQKLATIKDPVFTKAKLKHLFGVDKLVKEQTSGSLEAKYSGYHHDKGWKLVKTGKVKFLSNPQICPKTGIVHVEQIQVEGITLRPPKTFFPPAWTRRKVIDKILEASQNIKNTAPKGLRKEITGLTSEGIEILMVVDENQKLITAFPIFRQ